MIFCIKMRYSADQVARLARQYSRASSPERRRISKKLGTISDARRYGGADITGSGVERDDAISALAGFGSGGCIEYMHGGSILGASIPLSEDYEDGLSIMGIPHGEVSKIARSLEQGKVPLDVLEFVAENAEAAESLHPDKYPWKTQMFDVVANGFENKDIDCEGVWENATDYLSKGEKKIPDFYDPSLGACLALTHLFELYALAKFHNIKKLNMEGREVYF